MACLVIAKRQVSGKTVVKAFVKAFLFLLFDPETTPEICD